MSEDIPDAPPLEPLVQRIVRAMSLSRLQSIVAILAGVATVSGAAISVTGVGASAHRGKLVAVVHAMSAAQSVTDATVEVLTPQNALVATLTPDASGRAIQQLREGVYLVRVSHPHYAVDVHRIEVQAGQTTEVRATLRPDSSASVDRTVNKGVSAIRRALGF